MKKMSRRVMSLLVVIALIFSLSGVGGTAMAATPTFPDAAGHWAENIINTLAQKGVIAGYPDGTVGPDNIITRGEFSALLVRYMKLDTAGAEKETPVFDDVNDHWSEKNIETLVNSGIIDPGDYGSSFQPNSPITRIEIIRMMVRSIGKGTVAEKYTGKTAFADDTVLDSSDKGYVYYADHYGLITGYPDNTIRPAGESTRAEAFALLVRQEKALEKIKNDDSSDGSISYPKAQVSFELPSTAHTDTEILIAPTTKYAQNLAWSLTRTGPDGAQTTVELADAVHGTLAKDGGNIAFIEDGAYTLTATATNSVGQETVLSKSITVYPVPNVSFTFPATTHTDKSITIVLVPESLYGLDVAWSVTMDGESVQAGDVLDGGLTNEGGTFAFKSKGHYVLTATATDATGRSFASSQPVDVYSVAGVEFNLPDTGHTDTAIELKTALTETDGLTVEWSLTRNSETVALSDYLEGSLDNNGGTIRFKEKGVYALTASVTDATGRVFETSDAITIYTVGSIGFYLPEIAHTDQEVAVETTFENLGEATVQWSLLKDGQAVSINSYITGSLGNDGGMIGFTQKGSYVLQVAFSDPTGRTYSYTSPVTVYPVPTLSFTAPDAVHTDTDIQVVATGTDLDGLSVEWLIDNTYGFQDWGTYVSGNLDNDGGSIRIKHTGVYELVARVTDATGRVFVFEQSDKIEVLPVLLIQFDLPAATHTDRTIDLRTMGNNNVLPVDWSLTKDGEAVSMSTYIEGALNSLGGKIRFTEAGEYVLTASMTDALGRTFSFSDTGTVYPIPQITLSVPQTAYAGETSEITVSGTDLNGLAATWTIAKDGGEAAPYTDYADGELTESGGNIAFHSKGEYVVTATMTDALGRVFTESKSITAYPIPQINLDIPQVFYAGEASTIAVSGDDLDGLSVVWTIAKDGTSAKPYTDYTDGALTESGGNIAFHSKGEYVVTATMTDTLGRDFAESKSVSVYPIPQIELDIPQVFYVGEPATISVNGDDLDGLSVVWTIAKDGGEAKPYTDYADGELSGNGGNIAFNAKGDCVVTATMTDVLGRAFAESKSVSVYPVPQIELGAPQVSYAGEPATISVTGNDLDDMSVVWTIAKDGGSAKPYTDYLDGELTDTGGNVMFPAKGEYVVTVTMTDTLGRAFVESKSVTVYPIPAMQIALPATNYSRESIPVTVTGSELNGLELVWSLSVDGGAEIPYSDLASGSLGASGGELRISTDKTITIRLTASGADANGRSFSFASPAVQVKPVAECSFTVPTSVHLGTSITVSMQTVSGLEGKNIVWTLTKDGNPASYTGTLGNNGGNISITDTGPYTLTASVTDDAGRTFSYSQTVSITNTAPNKPTASATIDRSNCQNGKLHVAFSVSSVDPDGDAVSYEYSGQSADGYYAAGAYTVKVRAKDAYGLYSDWTDINFSVVNSAPATPVITRSPDGNSVAPGTAVTITAASTDPDGDAITYVWDGRLAETSTAYPLGKNTVKVKAVDSTGLESPWAAVIFFVADSEHGGGMMLTGPESTIIENGVEGATIVNWTFTVPPVTGHNATYDYGQVRGYNQLTGQWEQLTNVSFDPSIGSSFKATDGNPGRVYSHNGVTMYGTMEPGIYTKLEMYYYTPHTCMYNKSNITYSVTFHFD